MKYNFRPRRRVNHSTSRKPFLLRLKASWLTYIRGVALPDEQPLFRVTPYHVMAIAFLKLALSIGGTAWILSFHSFQALPMMLITQILGQSAIFTLHHIAHHANHDAISQNHKAINKWVAEICSVIALTLPWKKYRKTHGFHHIPDKLATLEDPDFRWNHRWGFVPGKPISYYWRQLWLTLVNPTYYLVFLGKRLQANFITATPSRRWMAIAWWLMVFTITGLTHAWLTLIFGYLMSVVVGYSISSLLQTITEHRVHDGDAKHKTFPRLLPVDSPNTSMWENLLNLYVRETILVTDLSQHQVHHYKPKNYEWPMVRYSQEAQHDLPDAIFGIRNHFHDVFKSLSENI